MTLRAMMPADVAQINEIEQLSFAIPWSIKSLENECLNDKARYLVICEGEMVVAYGGFWKILDEGHITNVAVHPQYRRRGYGLTLMKNLISMAKTWGITAMTLEVRVSNLAAQQLYERVGFAPKGIRPKYYANNEEDALVMWQYFA